MRHNPMSRFELFIGVWNTTGEVLATEANPAGALIATDTYRWLPELIGRRWTISGEKVRFRGSFNAPRNRLSGRWEMKRHQGGWEPWIELELVRA